MAIEGNLLCMLPTYSYTSLNTILAQTKVRLRLTNTTTEDLFLKSVIREGINEMMTRWELIEKTETLEICDFVAVLPCDFVKFDRRCPLVFTVDGRAEGGLFMGQFTVTYTGGPFITCSPITPINQAIVVPTINIQNGKIYFSNNVDSLECTISYLAVNMTPEGDILIPALNERPLINYGCYQYCHTMGLPYQEYKLQWVNCKLDRRGMANMLDSFERQQLSRIMNLW